MNSVLRPFAGMICAVGETSARLLITRKELPSPPGRSGKIYIGQFDFMERYNATGGGFLKIPDSQVTLSEGVLEQNPGWDSAYDFISLPYYAN